MPQWGFRHDPEGSFASKVDKDGGPDASRPWLGTIDHGGYGVFRIGRKQFKAHRYALEQKLGRPIREGYLACHSRECWTRACCNPAHLYEGTYADNAADTLALGRFNLQRGNIKRKLVHGEENPQSKLLDWEIVDIYQRVWAGENVKGIADEYGITYQHVYDIKNGKRAAEITGHENTRPPLKRKLRPPE